MTRFSKVKLFVFLLVFAMWIAFMYHFVTQAYSTQPQAQSVEQLWEEYHAEQQEIIQAMIKQDTPKAYEQGAKEIKALHKKYQAKFKSRR